MPDVVAVSQVPLAAAAVAPLTSSVPCPRLPTLITCVWLMLSAARWKFKAAGLGCAIGDAVTCRRTAIDLLSGMKLEPVMATVPL